MTSSLNNPESFRLPLAVLQLDSNLTCEAHEDWSFNVPFQR